MNLSKIELTKSNNCRHFHQNETDCRTIRECIPMLLKGITLSLVGKRQEPIRVAEFCNATFSHFEKASVNSDMIQEVHIAPLLDPALTNDCCFLIIVTNFLILITQYIAFAVCWRYMRLFFFKQEWCVFRESVILQSVLRHMLNRCEVITKFK